MTGGAIRPNKSFVYLVGYQFKANREYYFTQIEEIDTPLLVNNEYNEWEELELIPASVRKETLGICLAPNRNMKDKFNYLKKKVSK